MNRQTVVPARISPISALIPPASGPVSGLRPASALDVHNQAGGVLQQERREVAVRAVQADHRLGHALELAGEGHPGHPARNQG